MGSALPSSARARARASATSRTSPSSTASRRRTSAFDVVFVSSLAVCALVGMLIMCKFTTTLMIVATAAVGAAGSTIGTSWLLAHKWAQFIALYAIKDVKALSSPFVYSQALYCVLLFLLGLLVQCKLEKKAQKDKDEKRSKVEIAPMANRGGASNEPLVGI